MNELTIIIGLIFVILIMVLILIREIKIKINNTATKIDFFDQKLDSENKEILTIINQQYSDILIRLKELEGDVKSKKEKTMAEDPLLYEKAVEMVLKTQKASATLFQRYFRIGYARAAGLIDRLEEEGIIGPADGALPREIFGKKSVSDIDAVNDKN